MSEIEASPGAPPDNFLHQASLLNIQTMTTKGSLSRVFRILWQKTETSQPADSPRSGTQRKQDLLPVSLFMAGAHPAEARRPRSWCESGGRPPCRLSGLPSGAPSTTVVHFFQGLPARWSRESRRLGLTSLPGAAPTAGSRAVGGHADLLCVISTQETVIFKAPRMCSLPSSSLRGHREVLLVPPSERRTPA